MLAIANLIDRPLVELVLRKDVADAAGITDKTPFAERAKALKGKTIAIQGVGSIVHAWERLVAGRGGLDIEKDVRIAPMDPPAMLAAMQTKSIDGFATSLPFTTEAVVKGKADHAGERRERRARPAAVRLWADLHAPRHVHQAARQMRARRPRARRRQPVHPGEAGRGAGDSEEAFRQDGPAVLAAAWKTVAQAHAKDLAVTVPGLEHSQKVSLEAKLLEPKDALKSFDGLYTDEFVR